MEEQKFELELRMNDAGVICNAETLKEMLPAKLKPYQYIVDSGNYENAKKDRAKLNNLVKLFKAKRDEFEKENIGDWQKAKSLIMDLEKMVTSVADELGDGIKTVEENEKLAKMEEVRQNALYVLPNLPIQVDFEKLYDRKEYDKKSMTVKKINEDLTRKVDQISNDWEMMQLFIFDLTEVEVEQVKEVYAANFNSNPLGFAKTKAEELIRLKNKVAEKQRNEATQGIINPTVENVDHAQELNAQFEREYEEKEIQPMQRILVEFESTRPFFDAMNQLIIQYKPKVKILKKENI